jgi:hypothetical protein
MTMEEKAMELYLGGNGATQEEVRKATGCAVACRNVWRRYPGPKWTTWEKNSEGRPVKRYFALPFSRRNYGGAGVASAAAAAF